jgi:hypothetical protein
MSAKVLAGRGVAQFDALVAQGTPMPMTGEEKRTKIGMIGGAPPPASARYSTTSGTGPKNSCKSAS